MPASSLTKRSLSIAGHRTSVALEPEFWAALDAMAAKRRLPLAALIVEIDGTRAGAGLASALRVAVLGWTEKRARSLQPSRAEGRSADTRARAR
ncbi:MAG: ribbon-helix-helix domain-containing protein [Cucumibacter sp.]